MRSFGFTAQERKVILFLLVIISIGAVVRIYKNTRPSWWDSASERAQRDSLIYEFSACTDSVAKDSTASHVEMQVPYVAAGESGRDPLIDINTATEEELQTLPYIGPVLARRILQYRAQHGRFTAPEELTRVKGIGEKIYVQIKPFIKA